MNISHPLILAGGLGTRLREVVPDKPKVMAEVNGRPFLEYILDYLISEDFINVTLLLGYKSEYIKNFYGDNYKNLKISYSVEREILGTGGAVKFASKSINNKYLFVLNGDTYNFIKNVKDILNVQNNSEVIFTKRLINVSRYGNIKVDEEGYIISLLEKSNKVEPGLINTGTYVINKNDLNSIEADKFSLEREYLPSQIKKKKVLSLPTNGLFIDIGVPNDYKRAQTIFKK